MPNLTSVFFELVNRTKTSLDLETLEQLRPKQYNSGKEPKKSQKDKLTQACIGVHNTTEELKSKIKTIQQSYLAGGNQNGRNQAKLVSFLSSETDKIIGSMGDDDIKHLTDSQRDEIDYQVRLVIQRTMSRISELQLVEKQRREELARINSNDGAQSFLNKFMRDEKKIKNMERDLQQHRDGMFWFLNNNLIRAGEMQSRIQQVRKEREMEKSKSMLHVVNNSDNEYGSSDDYPKGVDNFGQLNREFHEVKQEHLISGFEANHDTMPDTLELSPEQVQELESENHALLDSLNDTLAKAYAAEKSYNEIAELQTELLTRLSSQTEVIQNLFDNIEDTNTDVVAANQQLGSANKRNRHASKMIIYISTIVALILLFYDIWLG
ncbi:hypothetical protein NADFUDRAFT_81856 [Nadsonia fulvescens var. elongata DSM 6958]|uniref:t-SNARE coiled-coil homology domain-containing protein n=1 Tax=Nadsonia fulvescens var. elongata DSM 6958 TaxID=857566 RepID=A0A1E3PPJ2_9ASCO|nr:hypothetical protein NADFUDRAFT_81856 [Nadsonia fulvescens var. elongata DSM 6958]